MTTFPRFKESFPHVSDEHSCRKMKGGWNESEKACHIAGDSMSVEYAPVKGGWVGFKSHIESDIDNGKVPTIFVAYSQGEVPVFSKPFLKGLPFGNEKFRDTVRFFEFSIDQFGSIAEAKEKGTKVALELYHDIKDGKAEKWGLAYCNPTGEKVAPNDEFAVICENEDIALLSSFYLNQRHKVKEQKIRVPYTEDLEAFKRQIKEETAQ
jgi:hypothetical protein